jgi:hypothetical protein
MSDVDTLLRPKATSETLARTNIPPRHSTDMLRDRMRNRPACGVGVLPGVLPGARQKFALDDGREELLALHHAGVRRLTPGWPRIGAVAEQGRGRRASTSVDTSRRAKRSVPKTQGRLGAGPAPVRAGPSPAPTRRG